MKPHILSLLFSALACGSLFAEEAAKHTCRILFLDRPAGAPGSLHLFDGTASREVDLPGMNLSKVYDLPAGTVTLALLPEAIDSAEKLPENAPAAAVPETTVDFYLIVSSDPENKVAPVSMRVVDAGASSQSRGRMLWANLTAHTIRGTLGDKELLIEPDSTTAMDAPRADAGDYPVSMAYGTEDADTDRPICETRWTHDPRASHLGIVFQAEGARAPRILVFPDLRPE